jgi:flagellar protein FlaG
MVQENQRAELTARNTKDFNPEEYLKDIVTITSIFNRKLKFFVNHNTNQVVVKVIDGETDKVIKEIPPEALQRLHSRLREAIGLLIDEEI